MAVLLTLGAAGAQERKPDGNLPKWEGLADTVLVHFGCSLPVLMDILFGLREAGGRLPYNLPKSMAAVERHSEDDITGPEPYGCKDGSVFTQGFADSPENRN